MSCFIGAASAADKPNFIIIFADDQGYNDLGCFGSPNIKTPNIDRLAKEGMRFTNFYSAASVCTPSRAALLTGCYPERVGNLPVLFPRSDRGLNPDETTIAEVLKANGYRTACVGKWHLGHHKPFLPTSQGFDEYFGIPYSNDMGIDSTMELAEKVNWRDGITAEKFKRGNGGGPPLLRDSKVIECPADQNTLTERYTDEALRFIRQSKQAGQPFFLYLPQTMPHIPLYASPKFQGKSDGGLYGDTIETIDWSVGQIVETLKTEGLGKNTLIVYTSDNGPWNLKNSEAHRVKGDTNRRVGGSAHPLRGFKFSRWEGGMREPTVMWWPGHVAANTVCDEVASSIDLLPTLAHLSGAKLPPAKIDGANIDPLLTKTPNAKSPHPAYFYRTEAVRWQNWKLKGKQLFNLADDVGEQKDVAREHPEIVNRLAALLADHKQELSQNARPPGQFTRPAQKLEGLNGWRVTGAGKWVVKNNVLKQTNSRGESAVFSPIVRSGKYSMTVEAKTTDGTEAFRLIVRATDDRDYVRWSCGAFSNTIHSLMTIKRGRPLNRSKPFKAQIEKDRWYQLRIDVDGDRVQCFIDGVAIHDETFKTRGKTGSVGLGTINSVAEFRNLRVTAADQVEIDILKK